MNRLLLIILVLHNPSLYGQEYVIDGFSDRFFVKINVDRGQSEKVFKRGTISILAKHDNKELVKVNTESISIDVNNTSKTIELQFSDQDWVLYDDFNFDGENDFALQEFFSSKGPGYSIYLFKDEKFVHDSEFSKIIQQSQGNFSLDADNQLIRTIGSGGCCWHAYSTFTVVDGVPKPVEVVIDKVDVPFHTTITKKWVDDKLMESEEVIVDLNDESVHEIMSFNLLNKSKRMVLYNINDRTLNYVLISGGNKAEFYFPIETVYKSRDFVIGHDGNSLTFVNSNAQYRIYQSLKGGKIVEVGIRVQINGKTYDLKGDVTTLKGNIDAKKTIKLDNVYGE